MSRMLRALKDLQQRDSTPPGRLVSGADAVRVICEAAPPQPAEEPQPAEPAAPKCEPEADDSKEQQPEPAVNDRITSDTVARGAVTPAPQPPALMPAPAPPATELPPQVPPVQPLGVDDEEAADDMLTAADALTARDALAVGDALAADDMPARDDAASHMESATEPLPAADGEAYELKPAEPSVPARIEQILDQMFVTLDETGDESVLEVQALTSPWLPEQGSPAPVCEVHMPPEPLPERPAAQHLSDRTAPFAAGVARHLGKPAVQGAYDELADSIRGDLAHCFAPLVLLFGAEADPDMAEIAASLAVTIQRHYPQILLIDVAGTQGHLTQRYQLAGRPGFGEMLLGNTDLQDTLVNVGEDIDLLPVGQITTATAVSADAVARILESCRASYDLVLVTATEPLRVSALTARCSDATYLLLRLGTTEQQAAADAAGWLQAEGARLLGCIVTNAGA